MGWHAHEGKLLYEEKNYRKGPKRHREAKNCSIFEFENKNKPN